LSAVSGQLSLALGYNKMAVLLTLEPYHEQWVYDFTTEASAIESAIGVAIIAIHHIGSTSIPGIYAKPIIDILIDAVSVRALDECIPSFQSLGYECLGEFGIPERRYFRKDNSEGIRIYQIHAFSHGSTHLIRHLAFRDYLRSHPNIAQAYSDLKRDLAHRFSDNIDAYIDGKDPFIKTTESDALTWYTRKAQQGAAANP
jgi:GrpB-like predicted nucleotidyltransferase (UPF0157 family)